MILYYVQDADAAETELAYAWDGQRPHRRPCTGPDGQRGTVLSVGEIASVGYYPARQTWRQMVTRPGSWIGYDSRPGPAALARRQIVPGYVLRILDREWTVPVALRWEGGDRGRGTLPVARRIDPETGGIVRQVRSEYEPLLLMADEVWDATDAGVDMPLQRAWDICVAALQVNYRVDAEEVDLLEMLGDLQTRLILGALVDRMSWPDLAEED